jgi:uncharacterized protein (TIGR02301 family)
MTTWRFPVMLAAAFALSGPAWAKGDQQQAGPQGQSNAQDQSAPDNDPQYHQQLLDLSQVLGGSHYLTALCHGQGDQQWRDRMRAVIQHAPQYSDELVEAFNRGYADQQQRFTDCDDSAQQAATELRAQGLRISQALAARHAAE